MTIKATIINAKTLDHRWLEHPALMVEENGEMIVYHCTNGLVNESGGAIVRQTYAAFETDRKILGFTDILVDSQKFYQYIQDNITKKYDVLFYNCEDFVNELLYGVKRSPQVTEWFFKSLAFGALVGGIAYQIGKRRSRKRRLNYKNKK